jgi:hypothetical protein
MKFEKTQYNTKSVLKLLQQNNRVGKIQQLKNDIFYINYILPF